MRGNRWPHGWKAARCLKHMRIGIQGSFVKPPALCTGGGIVHRDIKPSNILLCGDELKLIDFNISRQLRKEVQADTLPLGSIGYAPPEQFGLTQTGPTSDIYAIGVVFNEMLTGHSPAVELAPGYAGHIVQRCVRMRSEDRYPNAAALQQALRRPFWL